MIDDSKRSRTVEGEFNEGQNRMGSTIFNSLKSLSEESFYILDLKVFRWL